MREKLLEIRAFVDMISAMLAGTRGHSVPMTEQRAELPEWKDGSPPGQYRISPEEAARRGWSSWAQLRHRGD